MSTSVVELHVISDSTGETAVRLVLALEAQFPDTEFEVVRHPRVETVDDVQLAVSRTKDRPAVIVYTLVDTQLRDTMGELCRRDSLHCCDLLGQPIEEVAAVSGKAAKMESGRRPPLDSHYFKRMEAIEFAVKFDDGLGAGLEDADIVLVGVSRTSKTPLSMYLGYLGYKVANVPIVREVELPKGLFEIDRAKIVGLTIDAERLSEIRQVRARLMRLSTSAYSELVEIYEELEHAAGIHRQLGCPVVDVSELSIEETAQRVLRLVERRKAAAAASAS
jgi:regulator of PEP synthase PpsR (kinase-PPPase family)